MSSTATAPLRDAAAGPPALPQIVPVWGYMYVVVVVSTKLEGGEAPTSRDIGGEGRARFPIIPRSTSALSRRVASVASLQVCKVHSRWKVSQLSDNFYREHSEPLYFRPPGGQPPAMDIRHGAKVYRQLRAATRPLPPSLRGGGAPDKEKKLTVSQRDLGNVRRRGGAAEARRCGGGAAIG